MLELGTESKIVAIEIFRMNEVMTSVAQKEEPESRKEWKEKLMAREGDGQVNWITHYKK